jgi:hypothetical protein
MHHLPATLLRSFSTFSRQGGRCIETVALYAFRGAPPPGAACIHGRQDVARSPWRSASRGGVYSRKAGYCTVDVLPGWEVCLHTTKSALQRRVQCHPGISMYYRRRGVSRSSMKYNTTSVPPAGMKSVRMVRQQERCAVERTGWMSVCSRARK